LTSLLLTLVKWPSLNKDRTPDIVACVIVYGTLNECIKRNLCPSPHRSASV
jgi:hypothetical protein